MTNQLIGYKERRADGGFKVGEIVLVNPIRSFEFSLNLPLCCAYNRFLHLHSWPKRSDPSIDYRSWSRNMKNCRTTLNKLVSNCGKCWLHDYLIFALLILIHLSSLTARVKIITTKTFFLFSNLGSLISFFFLFVWSLCIVFRLMYFGILVYSFLIFWQQ